VVQNNALLREILQHAAEVVYQTTGNRKNMDFGEQTMIIISSVPPLRPGMEFVNAGCIIENMVLAATDLGIQSVVIAGAPSALALNPELQKKLGIPEDKKPLLGASFGYGAEEFPIKEHTITINRI
jgi:nitroreductase